MQRNLSALALAVLSSSIITSPCIAQHKVPVFPAGKYKEQPEPRQVTKKEITIPGFPKYPGAKFLDGQQIPRPQGVEYSITYTIPKASETQVIPYYAGVLNGDWKITQQEATFINAVNDKTNAHCSIFVNSLDQVYSSIDLTYYAAN